MAIAAAKRFTATTLNRAGAQEVTMETIGASARTTTLMAGMALAAACAHNTRTAVSGAPSEATTGTAVTAAAAVPLRIESHHSSDVVVYAARGPMRQRLGTVTGATTRVLSIPGRFTADAGSFYLVVHAVGGRAGSDVSSPTIVVQPGQTVVWTLESDLSVSALSIE